MTSPSRFEGLLQEIKSAIKPPSEQWAAAAQARLDSLTKPPGSLGRLEEFAIRLAAIQGTDRPSVRRKVVVVMAGDHGITAEGVSLYPSEVTRQMLLNFLNGGAAVNALAGVAGARVSIVDMGVASDSPPPAGIVNRRIASGANNFARGPAMTREQALRSVLAGAEQAGVEVEAGVDLLVAGDMGIGNTTAATAIVAAVTGAAPEAITGPGTGLDAEGVRRKAGVIRAALQALRPDPNDPIDVLAKVGGFEIGGLAGLFLGAALHRVAIVADGLISTAGAMLAAIIVPAAVPYIFAGHLSPEPAHQAALARLGIRPILALEMRLGEGTGAVLASVVLEASCRICSEMATFAEARVSGRG